MKVVIEVTDEQMGYLANELGVRKHTPGYFAAHSLEGIVQQAFGMGMRYFEGRAWRRRRVAQSAA
jgi:hypothetical protein